jgi:hypothetical protein
MLRASNEMFSNHTDTRYFTLIMCLCDALSPAASSRDVMASRTGTGTPVADSMCTTLPLRQLPGGGRLLLLTISCRFSSAAQHNLLH